MLQALLAERFKPVVRREPKEQRVYALVVDKDGPKLKESAPGAVPSDKPFPNGAGDRKLVMVIGDPDGLQTVSRLKSATVFEADTVTLPGLARGLRRYVDLPVIDMTGLKGTYQVAMNVPERGVGRRIGARGGADSGRPTDDVSDPGGVSIFASVQKLGLQLEKRKAPIEHIVVEHLERAPTEN